MRCVEVVAEGLDVHVLASGVVEEAVDFLV